MPWREAFEPVRMQRVAVVAPPRRLRDVLVRLADAGTSSSTAPRAGTRPRAAPGTAGERAPAAARRHRRAAAACWRRRRPDLDDLGAEPAGSTCSPARPSWSRYARRGGAGGAGGRAGRLVPAAEAVPAGRTAWRRVGGALVPLPLPRGRRPADAAAGRADGCAARSPRWSRPTPPCPTRDVDPTLLAGLAYVLMFGMMFGDAGHGALLLLAGVAAARRPAAPAGAAAAGVAVRGRRRARPPRSSALLYGEFFGPTGVLPVLWLAPLERAGRRCSRPPSAWVRCCSRAPTSLGTVNRWREGGRRCALYAPAGIAGAALFLGLGGAAAGRLRWRLRWLVGLGVLVALAGLVLAGVGLARRGGRRRAPASLQAASSSSTASCGSAPTWCRSRGWPPSA